MKKYLAIFLSILMVLSVSSIAYAKNDKEPTVSSDEINAIVAEHMTVQGNIKEYSPFIYNGRKIQLYPETLIGCDEAMDLYADAYKLCAELALEYNIDASIDNKEFQEFAKINAAMNENGTKEFVSQCMEFAKFLDFYENTAINEKILELVMLDGEDVELELDMIMPRFSSPTVEAEDTETVSENASFLSNSSNSYNATAAVSYAQTWWNKTNNSDYPYYASYYNFNTSSNSYNDLDANRSNQSNPRRSWSDCADFVSQCLDAGGVPEIKNGLINPHNNTANWYYRDSKPSNTWGGASNFYNHWRDRAGVASNSSYLGLGDAVSIDLGGDGVPDHTVIIVEVGTNNSSSSKYLAAHTRDRYKYYYANGTLSDFTLKYLYDKGWGVYGYEIDTIF